MSTIHSRRPQRVALTILTVAAFAAAAFVTPQARAFARQVIEFFRRADSHVRQLPPEQIPVSPDASEPTAMPPAPLVSLAEAQDRAGFDIRELPSTPQGFVFAGAMAREGWVSIQYDAQGGGGALVITESVDGFVQSEWDQAPAEAISQVTVGGQDAEIVQGTFVVYAGETVARWNPDAPIVRLRWVSDGVWFEMARFGGVESIAYLDREAMIALAESLR